MRLTPVQRTRLNFALTRLTAWLEHVDECPTCRSPSAPCARGRSLCTAWETARNLADEGAETEDYKKTT